MTAEEKQKIIELANSFQSEKASTKEPIVSFNLKRLFKKNSGARWGIILVPLLVLMYVLKFHSGSIGFPFSVFVVMSAVVFMATFLIKIVSHFSSVFDFSKVGYNENELLEILRRTDLTQLEKTTLATAYIAIETAKLEGKNKIYVAFVIGIYFLCGISYAIIQFSI
jgi:hypothetical protein